MKKKKWVTGVDVAIEQLKEIRRDMINSVYEDGLKQTTIDREWGKVTTEECIQKYIDLCYDMIALIARLDCTIKNFDMPKSYSSYLCSLILRILVYAKSEGCLPEELVAEFKEKTVCDDTIKEYDDL